MEMDGEPVRSIDITDEAASQVADLRSLIMDLDYSRRLAELHPRLPLTVDEPGATEVSYENAVTDADDIRAAVMESAVIAYGRCFASGRSALVKQHRRRIGEFVEQLDPDDRVAHERVIQVRDQHVAHRVDRLMHPVKVARLTTQDGTHVGIGVLAATKVGDGVTLPSIVRLAGKLLPILRDVLDEETHALDSIYRGS
jgi:hypothetical protein